MDRPADPFLLCLLLAQGLRFPSRRMNPEVFGVPKPEDLQPGSSKDFYLKKAAEKRRRKISKIGGSKSG